MQLHDISASVSSMHATGQNAHTFHYQPKNVIPTLLNHQILSLQKNMTDIKTNKNLTSKDKQHQLDLLQEQLDQLNDQKGKLEQKEEQKKLEKQIKDQLDTTTNSKDQEQAMENLKTTMLTNLMTSIDPTTKQPPEDLDESIYQIYTRLAAQYDLSKLHHKPTTDDEQTQEELL